jgi:hypothetical protein
MYFGETFLAKPFLDIYKCPFLIFPKYFPEKKQDILNNKCLDLLKEKTKNKNKNKKIKLKSKYNISIPITLTLSKLPIRNHGP